MAEIQFYEAKPGPIEKIALPDQTICVWVPTLWVAYRVAYVEPLPRSAQLVFNQGAVAAGGGSGDVQLLNLELSDTPPGLAQLRFYPLDDIRVTLKRGVGDTRFKTLRVVAEADRFTRLIDPCLHTTEFVILSVDEPYLNVTNPTDYNLAQTRVAFFGYRFVLDDLKKNFKTPKEAKEALGPITFVNAGGM